MVCADAKGAGAKREGGQDVAVIKRLPPRESAQRRHEEATPAFVERVRPQSKTGNNCAEEKAGDHVWKVWGAGRERGQDVARSVGVR